ncbi:MAG: ribonuclease D [Rickettsiaceae bacterium]|nr:ribonuclease D [Rickettsiaceae bacterium]
MLFINTTKQLEDLADILSSEKLIGIDTEFVRKNTYFAKLALVQISTHAEIYLIDPLSLDLAAIKGVLIDKDIVKIFHACSQDVRIFHDVLGIETQNIFDTQEAIKFLGIRDQISYQDACLKILNIAIEKEQQFREWDIRPIPHDMELYAAQDVEHLIDLYNSLKKMMEEKKIYNNFCRFMESFSAKEFYQVKFDEMWKKVRTKETNKRFLYNLQLLASFRESCAIELNIPRMHAISDNDLLKITEYLPQSVSHLAKLNIRLSKLNKSLVDKLFDLCAGLKEK